MKYCRNCKSMAMDGFCYHLNCKVEAGYSCDLFETEEEYMTRKKKEVNYRKAEEVGK